MQPRHALLAGPLVLAALVHCGSSSDDTLGASEPAREAGADAATAADAADAAVESDAAARPLARMTKARSLFAALNGKDGRIRAVGGLGTAGLDDTTETYDPTTDKWTQDAASASVRRYGHG
ncbi:MAG TPA: kelch repeat-containing protein, partial [Labilithrix sp.]|nr:kelch repeat-containing protein [Labilithrix sp.]